MAEEQTLTMDETTPESGQFSEEEMDSLKVGEEMQEAQDSRLAGKYENAEQLEKAYIELEKKLGEKSEPVEEVPESTEPQAKDEPEEQPKNDSESTSVLDQLWGERDKGFSDDTLRKLAEANPGELAKEYLQYRTETTEQQPQGLSEADVVELKGLVGGEEGYQQVVQWAEANLSKQEQDMYDAVMDRGDKLACYFAVQAIMARYKDNVGTDGTLLTGKPSSSAGDVFRSQPELVAAMSDPRYDRDPAYRRDVQQKLERSEINF